MVEKSSMRKKLFSQFAAALRKLRPRWFKKSPETSAETSAEYSSSEPPWDTSAECTSAETSAE